MPPGVMGELELRSMRVEIQKLAPIVQSHIGGGTKDESVPIDLELDEFRLSGKLNSVYGGQSVHFRTAKLNPKDHLRAWIEHLALCATSQGKESSTVLIGRDAVVTFRHVSTGQEELHTLCELFWEGLMLPIPFFPASGMAFVEAELSRAKDPFAKARSKWNGLWRQTGEKDNVFIARCFDASDPLDNRFAELARRVLAPMLQHATREEL
jgi:exodeoxyribonuclease V gamma subunit